MENTKFQLSANKLVKYLGKPVEEFTKQDLIKYCEDNNIHMLNFRYVPEDGKLKTLSFVINSSEHLDNVLSCGERVDGSSLFSYIEAGSSDLYVVPRYRTAFLNPFTEEPTLDILCSFYSNDGKPLESSPEYIMRKADAELQKQTGLKMKVLGELEYYVISDIDESYQSEDQKGYHASTPFVNWEKLRMEAMRIIASCGGMIKYSHSEVGCFATENTQYEQHEIEFLPTDLESAGDQLVIAKWVLRMLANRQGVNISFSPKISVGMAGSGLHIHILLEKDGENITYDFEKQRLSDEALKSIAGLLDLSDAITAFGNTIPVSYLRLVPHQEAPTNICWGDRNRSVLVRVPLGWNSNIDMARSANPQQQMPNAKANGRQTFEIRSPDGSADIYRLLASISVACRHGFSMPNALEKARELYVNVNIFKPEFKEKLAKLAKLPTSCYESAEVLLAKRAVFEEFGVFPAGTIDDIADKLISFDDKNLSERLYGKNDEIAELVEKYMNFR